MAILLVFILVSSAVDNGWALKFWFVCGNNDRAVPSYRRSATDSCSGLCPNRQSAVAQSKYKTFSNVGSSESF